MSAVIESDCTNDEVEQFFQIIASEASEAVKADLIACQWRKFCRTKAEIEAAFYSIDVLKCSQKSKSLLTFMCFAIMNSHNVRRNIIYELLYAGDLFTSLGAMPIPDVIMILTSCSIDIVTNDEMKLILDYVLSLPQENLPEQVILLERLARSLPFVDRGHALRIFNVINSIAQRVSQDNIELSLRQSYLVGGCVVAIAKEVEPILRGRCSFNPDIWKEFLRIVHSEHEIPRICQIPIVPQDPTELPYMVKMQR